MKKYLSVFFIICFILSFFSACAKPKLPDPEEDELNFLGSKFTVITTNAVLFKKAGETAANDRFNQRLYDIQNKFNLVFEEKYSHYPEMDCITGSMTGNFVADMIICPPSHLYEIYKINAGIPIEDILDDPDNIKYGTPSLIAGSVFAGKQYGIFPYLHDTPPDIAGVLSLNMDYVSEFNLPDPHEMIENGEWDWEHFKAFLESATFSDGTDKYCGIHLSTDRNAQNAYATFIFSNGGSMIKFTEAGYKVAFDSAEAIEAMEFIASVFASPYADSPKQKDTKYFFTFGYPIFDSEEDEMHVMPAPFGPHGSPDTVSAIMYAVDYWNFPIFSIFSKAETAIVTEELFEPLSALYPNGWKDYVKDNVFYDDTDYEYFCRAADNIHYIEDIILEDLYSTFPRVVSGEYSLQSSIDSIKDSVQILIDEKYNH